MINYPNNNQEHENDNPIAQESLFPYVCGWSRRQGAYVLPALDDLLQEVQCGARPVDTLDESLVRIEVALSSLWPEIEDYFFDNVFAGFMECCMSMMRAADIERRGKSPSGRMLGQLIEELAQTLMDLEYTLSVQMAIEDMDEYKRRLALLLAEEDAQDASQNHLRCAADCSAEQEADAIGAADTDRLDESDCAEDGSNLDNAC